MRHFLISKKNRYFSSSKFLRKTFISLSIILALSLFCFSYFNKSPSDYFNTFSEGKKYSELEEVKEHSKSFDSLKGYFQKIAEDKGADYAFEIMRQADIPYNMDMHLLGHAVGDILYKQKGLNGIKLCTNDFRNACSHSIVVGLFSDHGEGALSDIVQACREAPGGSGAYTICFHGLGHGILAATGYDIEKTVQLCTKFGTRERNYSEKAQCIGGAVMEIMGGGGHDHEIWVKQRTKYLNKKDPLSLCKSDLIPEDSKFFCFDYSTPYLFEAAGANLNNPEPNDFSEAFKYCDKIPANEERNRNSCYGGFGKEFVVLVRGRDIRKASIANISDDNLKTVFRWCSLADNKNGTAACLLHSVDSLFWGGENDVIFSLSFCGLLSDDKFYQGSCYNHLISIVHHYIKDSQYINNFCHKLPTQHKDLCLSRIKS